MSAFVISNALFSIFSDFTHILFCLSPSFAAIMCLCQFFPTANMFSFLLLLNKLSLFLLSPDVSALVMGALNDSCSSTGTCLSLYQQTLFVFAKQGFFLSFSFFLCFFFCVFFYVCAVHIYSILNFSFLFT